jgi:hypothetical protein
MAVVSGVPGSSLRRSRWPNSLRMAVRGANPKSASLMSESSPLLASSRFSGFRSLYSEEGGVSYCRT